MASNSPVTAPLILPFSEEAEDNSRGRLSGNTHQPGLGSSKNTHTEDTQTVPVFSLIITKSSWKCPDSHKAAPPSTLRLTFCLCPTGPRGRRRPCTSRNRRPQRQGSGHGVFWFPSPALREKPSWCRGARDTPIFRRLEEQLRLRQRSSDKCYHQAPNRGLQTVCF